MGSDRWHSGGMKQDFPVLPASVANTVADLEFVEQQKHRIGNPE